LRRRRNGHTLYIYSLKVAFQSLELRKKKSRQKQREGLALGNGKGMSEKGRRKDLYFLPSRDHRAKT